MSDGFVKLDEKALLRAERALSEVKGGADKAIARAMNRAVSMSRTQSGKLLTAAYTVKSGTVKKDFHIRRAKPKDMVATLKVSGTKIPYKDFKIRPRNDTTGKNIKPVKVEIRKGNPFKVERGYVWQGNVFKRRGKSRLPVIKEQGPAVAQMLKQEKVLDEVIEGLEKNFSERLDHEVEYILSKSK